MSDIIEKRPKMTKTIFKNILKKYKKQKTMLRSAPPPIPLNKPR